MAANAGDVWYDHQVHSQPDQAQSAAIVIGDA